MNEKKSSNWWKSIGISVIVTFVVDVAVLCLSGGKFTLPCDWSPKVFGFILFELIAISVLTQGLRNNRNGYNNKGKRLAFGVLITYAVIASVGLAILNLVAYKANPLFSSQGATGMSELLYMGILFFLTNLATVLLIPEILSGLQRANNSTDNNTPSDSDHADEPDCSKRYNNPCLGLSELCKECKKCEKITHR